MLGSISRSLFPPMPSIQQAGRMCSNALTKLAQKTNLIALTFLSLYLVASIPTASAGAGTYLECIKLCRDTMGKTILSAVVCPTVCAPFLLAPK